MVLSWWVQRREPELIRPAITTPHVYKKLSDIDNHHAMRIQARTLIVYRSVPEKATDVAQLLREGLARALMFYYPLAGRLRERSGGRLVLECTGEGVLFVEGDADFSVEELGVKPHGSVPYYDELIHEIPVLVGIIGCPLLLVQVTRLKCSGITVGVRANHALMDASGKGQFLKAVIEMAQGAAAPSVLPVWQRELLCAPPRVIQKHPSNDQKKYMERCSRNRNDIRSIGSMTSRSFFFGSSELATLRESLPEGLRNCSTFEVLASFLWRSRVIALNLDPEDKVWIGIISDIRSVLNPPLPKGYYGNAIITTYAFTTASVLRTNPLWYAVALVRKAKFHVGNKYVRSIIDHIAETGTPLPSPASVYIVSDLTKTALASTDIGWGKPAFTIPSAILPQEGSIGTINYFTPARERNGEEQVVVWMNMPERTMERLVQLIDDLQIVRPSRL